MVKIPPIPGYKSRPVKVPHVDLSAANSIIADSLIRQSGWKPGPDAPPPVSENASILRAYDEAKAEIGRQYQQAAQGYPDAALPPSTGLNDIAFYPTQLTMLDGTKVDEGASVGRTNLRQLLTNAHGPARAEEQLANFAKRNARRQDWHFPLIHPRGMDEHLGRDIYIVRHNGPAEDNGAAVRGLDLGLWAKADDNIGMIDHEGKHLKQDWAASRGPKLKDRMPDRSIFWESLLHRDPNDTLRELALDQASQYGFDIDDVTGDLGFLDPGRGDAMLHNMGSMYYLRPEEIKANLDSWKNSALKAHGFETLADAGNEMKFLRRALTSDIMPDTPKGSKLSAEQHNYLHLPIRAIYESMGETGREQMLKVLHKAGAAGVPAALASGEGE